MLRNPMMPDQKAFEADPGGYAASAWQTWAIVCNMHGGRFDPSNLPTAENLKDPILWLSQVEALTQAAVAVIKTQPAFENMPEELRGVCHTQYCGVALMLVGYSVEVCLKAMVLLKEGTAAYIAAERKYANHDLVKLASPFLDLSEREKSILRMLKHFVTWAGRYPDPGMGAIEKSEEIFTLSEKHEITLRDVFALAAKVTGYVKNLIPNESAADA